MYDDDAKAAYQKYADLASDPAKRGEAVQARIEALIKSYTAERDSLVKGRKSYQKSGKSDGSLQEGIWRER